MAEDGAEAVVAAIESGERAPSFEDLVARTDVPEPALQDILWDLQNEGLVEHSLEAGGFLLTTEPRTGWCPVCREPIGTGSHVEIEVRRRPGVETRTFSLHVDCGETLTDGWDEPPAGHR